MTFLSLRPSALVLPAHNRYMLWVYERGLEDLRIGTSFDNATKEYVLVIARGPRNEVTERFKDTDSFQSRLEVLEEDIARERWTPVGHPIVLRDGWKIG